MELDDRELAKKVKQGDRHSFDVLVSRHKRQLYSKIYRMTRSHHITDELLQETFLKLYTNIHQYKEEYNFYPWLHRIAVNLTINYLKKEKKRRKDRSLEEEMEERYMQPAKHNNPFNPEIAFQRTERDSNILAAMQKLTPIYRATLVLRVFDGLSYKEIADTLNCNMGTVMSRLNRARSQLKDLLKEYL